MDAGLRRIIRAAMWYCFKCDPDCGEIGWFRMPMGVNFGGSNSPVLTGYCSRGHETTIRGEDVAQIWLAPEQKVPAWYPVQPN